MYQRILVPLDGSEYAESVLPLVCMLASMKDAEITLLRIVEYPLEAFPTSEYIVMSTTGEGQCSWGLGSIANRILREAQVPVSLLRKGPGPSVFDPTKRQNYTQPVYLESQHEYSR